MPWPCKPQRQPETLGFLPNSPSKPPSTTMTPDVKERIETLIASSPIVVFMKGNKLMPQCGVSNNVVQILLNLGVPFETFDVLSDMEIRQGIKEYSDWPTIPQIYVNGEFIGGSDILIEMYNKGELREKLELALASA
jgi:monothiol glutaredoxin